jgi:hypothetical protein
MRLLQLLVQRRAHLVRGATLATLFLIAAVPSASAAPARGWAAAAGVDGLGDRSKALSSAPVGDRLAINDLFARWGVVYDEARLDLLPDLFTTDATFIVLLADRHPIAEAHGRNSILENVRNSLKQQGDQRRHLVSNVVINQMGERHAEANAYGLVAVTGATISVGSTVFYRAWLTKGDDGAWRFSKLIIGMDQYAGTPPRLEDKAH